MFKAAHKIIQKYKFRLTNLKKKEDLEYVF